MNIIFLNILNVIKCHYSDLFSEGSGFLATDFMYLENSKSGIIKRSGMDVLAQGSNQTMLVYGVS